MRRCIVEVPENLESVDLSAPDANEPPPQLEAELEAPNEPASSQAPNPLSPGGVRFEQVYARSKQAERALAAEREKSIALEARLTALETKTTTKADEEYTPAQLEAFIAQNQITRADATEYIQKQTLKKAVETAKQEIQQEFVATDRISKLNQGVAAYLEAIPAIKDVNSADRIRLEEEYEWLASVEGVDATKLKPVEKQALQLKALRSVFGSLDNVKKRTTVTTNVETQQELPGGNPPPRNPNPDQALINALKPHEVAHYKKMMAAGRYVGGWKDVVAELKFDPNNRTKVVKK
jgi:hypothetical protein